MTISLRSILKENIENQVSLTRIDALIAKVAEELSEADQKKLAEPYVELQLVADAFNQKPHTIFNNDEWVFLKFILMGKVAELRLVVDTLAEKNKKIDCCPLKDALELLLTN